MPGRPRRLTVFLDPSTARTMHDLLGVELARRAAQADLQPTASARSSDEVRELTMTRDLIGGWLATLEQSWVAVGPTFPEKSGRCGAEASDARHPVSFDTRTTERCSDPA